MNTLDTLDTMNEIHIHRDYNAGSYAAAYGGVAPTEETPWPYTLGFYADREDHEAPEFVADLRTTHASTLDALGIATA